MRLAAFNGPSPKIPFIDAKKITDIFYISRVIANFVPNFVGMATGVDRKMQLAAFDGPFPNPPFPIGLNAKISQKFLTQAQL